MSDKKEKVLRIGIVQRGKIIEERKMKKRQTVSVGTDSKKATFEVLAEGLPKSFDLFEYDGKNYFLRFTEKMIGRIQLSGGTVEDFDVLEKAGKMTKRTGEKAVQLNDASRGKVILGDLTVMFQFADADTASSAIPILPASIRGSFLQNIDTQFTVILLAVASFQLSIVGYARSLPYVEPTSIEEVDERYQALIMPKRKPQPKIVKEEGKKGGDEQAKKKKPEGDKKKKQAKKVKKSGSTKKVQAPKESAADKKARLAKKVQGKGLLRVLGAKRDSKGGGALADVFNDSDGGAGNIGDAFSGIQGVDIASAGGQKGTRGAASGGKGVGIGDLATEGGGDVSSGNKTEAAVRGDARAEAPEVDGELSSEAITRVMKRQLRALRSCYEGALKRDSSLSGKIVIRFEILENGRTSNIEFDNVSLTSRIVESCIMRRAKRWRFPKPEGGSVFVAYPIVFTPSG